jgi:branched-chain amino acid transport system substrate-binding protein
MYRQRLTTAPGRRALVALMAALALTTGACGSRLNEQALDKAEGPFRRADASITSGSGATVEQANQDSAPIAASDAGGHTTGGAMGVATSSPAGGTTGSAPSSARPAGASSVTSPSKAATAAGTAPDSSAAAAPGAPQAGTAAATTGKKSEIVLGSWGAESGILGAVSGPAPPAIRAWSAYINAAGGINGHPVRVIMGDDNADPARSLATVRRMVEQDKVIGFFNEYSFTLASVLPYLNDKQIPVIGSIGGDASGDHSPMMFNPLVGADTGQAWGFINNAVTQAPGKKKIGIVYCREAATCAALKDSFKKLLPYQGLEVVYEAFVSLAQPDYTGEMLQAQRAGAEVILPLIDTAALNRLSTSAHRQNYNPAFVGTYNLNQDLLTPFAKELEGLFLTGRVPPWDSSPKLQFYRDAMSRYQPKAARGDLGAGVFVNGKLLAEKIGPFIQEPPTTANLLEGLYALKGETLGGLLPGIGFEKGVEHVKSNQCIIPVRYTGGKTVAHDAQESFVCAPGWKPVA